MVVPMRRIASSGLLVGLIVTGGLCPLYAQQAVSRGVRQQSVAVPHEPNLLERMQDEVATIARQTRSGIVTIQDARTWQIMARGLAAGQVSILAQQRNQAANGLPEPSATKLQQEIADLQAKIGNQDSLLRGLRAKRTSESEVEGAEYDRERNAALLYRARVLLGLQGVGDISRQEKAVLEADIAMAEVEVRHLTMQMQIGQARAKAGLETADQVKARANLVKASQDSLIALSKKLQEVANHYETTSFFPWSPLDPTMQEALGNTLSGVPKSGSGFSIGDGYILTTADVVTGMINPIATTDTGNQLRLRLVALDPELNVALMRTVPGNPPPVSLPPLTLGDSTAVVPGHFAISIGNQAGQINSVALSMVSGIRTQGLNSSSHFYPALLQIDGVIGAGNSGAPVMNARGEVIGMVAASLSSEPEPSANVNEAFNYSVVGTIVTNGTTVTVNGQQRATTSRMAAAGTSNTVPGGQQGGLMNRLLPPPTSNSVTQQGIGNGVMQEPNRSFRFTGSSSLTGFAIPVNSFKCLLPALKTGVDIVHAWLGTELEESMIVSEENAGQVRVERKVLVRALYAGGPAAKSGALRPGDRLVSINGRPTNTANDVRAVVLVQLDPGQKVEIQIVRNQTPMTVSLTVEARPTIMPPLEDLPARSQSQSRR